MKQQWFSQHKNNELLGTSSERKYGEFLCGRDANNLKKRCGYGTERLSWNNAVRAVIPRKSPLNM